MDRSLKTRQTCVKWPVTVSTCRPWESEARHSFRSSAHAGTSAISLISATEKYPYLKPAYSRAIIISHSHILRQQSGTPERSLHEHHKEVDVVPLSELLVTTRLTTSGRQEREELCKAGLHEHCKRVDVDPFSALLIAVGLRCHVPRRASQIAPRLDIRSFLFTCETEICKLEGSSLIYKEVLRLQEGTPASGTERDRNRSKKCQIMSTFTRTKACANTQMCACAPKIFTVRGCGWQRETCQAMERGHAPDVSLCVTAHGQQKG